MAEVLGESLVGADGLARPRFSSDIRRQAGRPGNVEGSHDVPRPLERPGPGGEVAPHEVDDGDVERGPDVGKDVGRVARSLALGDGGEGSPDVALMGYDCARNKT